MPTNFPTSLDTLTNPTSGQNLNSPTHAGQHSDANDAIEAIQAKLGIGASTPTTTGHVLQVTGAGATGYGSVPPPVQISAAAAAAGDYLARIKQNADTQYRMQIGMDGSGVPELLMGPGSSTAPDVRLYRDAANVMRLADGDTFRAQNGTFDSYQFNNSHAATWAAQQNNYAGTGYESAYWRITLTGNQTLTGIVPWGVGNPLVMITNVDTADTLTLSHQNTSSTTTNRFMLPSNADMPIAPLASVILVYDPTSQRWRVMAVSGIASGTWTPTLTFNTPGNVSVAYTTRLGHYRRIDDMVFCWFNIHTSSFTHSTASGDLKVQGLPFTSTGVDIHWSPALTQFQGITATNYTQFGPSVSTSATEFGIRRSGSAQTATQVMTTNVPSGGTVILRGMVIYQCV
jgi:hypothetical protein